MNCSWGPLLGLAVVFCSETKSRIWRGIPCCACRRYRIGPSAAWSGSGVGWFDGRAGWAGVARGTARDGNYYPQVALLGVDSWEPSLTLRRHLLPGSRQRHCGHERGLGVGHSSCPSAWALAPSSALCPLEGPFEQAIFPLTGSSSISQACTSWVDNTDSSRSAAHSSKGFTPPSMPLKKGHPVLKTRPHPRGYTTTLQARRRPTPLRCRAARQGPRVVEHASGIRSAPTGPPHPRVRSFGRRLAR